MVVGGAGTLVGVALLAGAPAFALKRCLRLRFPHAARFGVVVFGVGAAGGAVGHHLFVKVLNGRLERRALIVGAEVGLGTALAVWTCTNFGQSWLGPFEPGREAQAVIRRSFWPAVAAGPLCGVAVSTLVARHLWEKFELV